MKENVVSHLIYLFTFLCSERLYKQNVSGLRKQGLGVSPIVQQNQEFSIQNEDFPALPGFKGVVC